MPYDAPKYMLYETLKTQPTKGMTIEHGSTFEFVELITLFKKRIPGTVDEATPTTPSITPSVSPKSSGPSSSVLDFKPKAKASSSMLDSGSRTPKTGAHTSKTPTVITPPPTEDSSRALKYSAYHTPMVGGTTFMLGWDHALHIKKGVDGFYAHAVYSGSYSMGNQDTWAYRIPAVGMGVPITRTPPKISFTAGMKRHEWAKYDLSAANLKLDRLITFSITSCSFACLFDEDFEDILVSHMAFAPPIPLAVLARDELGIKSGAKMQLLASINSTPDELRKFKSDATFPKVTELDLTPVMISRGPMGLTLAHVDDTPFMTHPYLGLDFSNPATIYFQGALGYNNDTTRGFREFPPFHSILSKYYPTFRNGTDAKAIVAAARALVMGEQGFRMLHILMLQMLRQADEQYSKDHWRSYHSDKFDGLLEQTTDGLMSPAKVPIPKELAGAERAIFLLTELAASPDHEDFKWIKMAVFAAWDAFQMRFSFDMDKMDVWAV